MNELPTPNLHIPHHWQQQHNDHDFLGTKRQYDECGSVRNDEILNLHLGSGAGPWISTLCLLQYSSHIHWLHLPKQSPRTRQKNLKIKTKLPTNRVILPLPKYTEPRAKRGRLEQQWQDYQAKTEKKKHNRTQVIIIQPWITKENAALREVDLEPNAKRRTDRTTALVSLYWLSPSVTLKQSFNIILYKVTSVDPIKLSRTWKKTNQIPKSASWNDKLDIEV